MSRLIRKVEVTVAYGDVFVNVEIEPQELPSGLRAKLHQTIDSISDQINLPVVGSRPHVSVVDSHVLLSLRDTLTSSGRIPSEQDVKVAQRIDAWIDADTKAASDREYGTWPYRNIDTTFNANKES